MEKAVVLEHGEKYVYMWKALYFRPQIVMKGDYKFVADSHDVGTFREGGRRGKESTVADSGRLVLTNRRLIWLQQRGTLRKTLHPIFELLIRNISGLSIQGRFAKRINVSDGTREYQFRIGGDRDIAEFQKRVTELTHLQSVSAGEAGESLKGPIEQLKELKELLDLGAITQEEYDDKKKKLLEKI